MSHCDNVQMLEDDDELEFTVNGTKNFELCDKKWLTIFDKVLTPVWKTFLWLKQQFDAKLLI